MLIDILKEIWLKLGRLVGARAFQRQNVREASKSPIGRSLEASDISR